MFCYSTNHSIQIIFDRMTRKSKGYGYVKFATKKGLDECLKWNGTVVVAVVPVIAQQLEGRTLRIEVAKPRDPHYADNRKQYNDTNKVIVNNLSYDTTSESLGNALLQFGDVEECNVVMNTHHNAIGIGGQEYRPVSLRCCGSFCYRRGNE